MILDESLINALAGERKWWVAYKTTRLHHTNNPFLKLRSFFGWSLLPFLRTDLDFVMYLDDDSCMATLESFKRIFLKDFKRKIQEVETFSTSTALRVKWWQTSIDGSLCLLPFGCLGAKLPLIRLSSYPSSSGSTGGPKIPHHKTLSRSNDRVPPSLKGWWRWASSMKRSAILYFKNNLLKNSMILWFIATCLCLFQKQDVP